MEEIKKMLKMNIQLLAGGETEDNTEETEETEDNGQQGKDNPEEKVLTQAQFDKALTKRLEKERKKMLEDFKAQLEEEKRIASLTEAEKLEEERKQIEKERAEVKREKLTTYAQRKLAEAKLPEEALNYLVKGSQEDIDAEIEKFSKMFNTSVNNLAESMIGAGAPQAKAGTKQDVQKDDFLKGLGL